ncbi:hypothetical protein WJX73_008792 [Symbiochloris irregularis]|uniref:ABC transporter domain-containing protein n=1 Tax=Symbiochloris irregularis TaxID=706552 RepID=A0AAW1NUA3_9CHLO
MAGLPFPGFEASTEGESGNAVSHGGAPAQHHDEEAGGEYAKLRKAVLEHVDPKQHSRHAVYATTKDGPEEKDQTEVINLDGDLTRAQLELITKRALGTEEQDSEDMHNRIGDRLNRVNVTHPNVEVRFSNLHAETEVYLDSSRNLPGLHNVVRDIEEWLLKMVHMIKRDTAQLVILNHLSGVLKPGRLTLLLGPPASGKTTLLKALAGKLGGSGLYREGEVTYNGRSFKDFRVTRTAAYVEQEDVHMGELTVRETFDFGARCMGAGTKAADLAELRRLEKEMQIEPDWNIDAFMKAESIEGKYKSVMTEYVVHMLGLGICADTEVGNAMRRGVSGGQKKRVTSGELLVGPKRVIFADEISTGLDSSTTYQIMKWMRDQAHTQKTTMLVSLLQPAPETFHLFDDVMLLAEGHIVYHGPTGSVLDYFSSMGFTCPERKATADFLQEVASKKDQQAFWTNSDKEWTYFDNAQMSDYFKKSAIGEQVQQDLVNPMQPEEQAHNEAALVKTRYALNNWEMFKACWDREILLVQRNLFLYGFRTFQTVLLAVFTALTYVKPRMHTDTVADGNRFISVLFFSLMICMFDGITELNLTVDRLPGFYRQRDNRFYSAWAFVLPVTLLRLPYSLLVAVVWSVLVYFSVNLDPSPGRFFTYVLLLWMLHGMGISLFRAISSATRNETVSLISGCFIFLVLLLLGGFLLSKHDTPVWVKWILWVNPVYYVQQALAINEFDAPRWQTETAVGGGTVGDGTLNQRGLYHEMYWVWVGLGVLILAQIIFNLITWVLSATLSPLGKRVATLPPHLIDLVQAKKLEAEGRDPNSAQGNSGKGFSAKKLAQVNATSSQKHMGTQNRVSDSGMQRASSSGIPSRKRLEALAGESRKSGSMRAMSVGSSDGGPAKGMVLPFTPLSLTFQGMSYFVTLPKAMDTTDPEKVGPKAAQIDGVTMLRLLDNCSGVFRPGVLTALVGSSGAGKTTLMDVLAGRKTAGKVLGDIKVGGYPKDQESFARVSGYVEQFDIHAPLTTVHEALLFSSRLRFTNEVDNETVKEFVEEVEELVELTPLCNSLVGIPGSSGLSVEQRKRLTIAVELVANPSIVFMDEPTSGLDARAAAIVMRAVRNTVDTGRTVVCTIHQPSQTVFESFDDLLLMKVGGQIIYHGPLGKQSITLVNYFEAIEGVPKLAEGLNPATWVLQISTPGMEKGIGVDFAEVFQNSGAAKEVQSVVDRESQPAPNVEPIKFSQQYAQSYFSQYLLLLKRLNTTYWRNVPYNGTRFIFGTVIALLMGCILWNIGTKRSTVQEFSNILGALYLAVLFLGIINAMSVQPIVEMERTVLYREHAAGMYAKMPFSIALCTVEVPYNFVQTCLFASIAYFMVRFIIEAGKFWWFALFIFLVLNLMTFYGIATVFLTPDLPSATVLSAMSYGFWNLFAGFLAPWATIPWWVRWIWYSNPITWGLYGIIITQMGDIDANIMLTDDTSQSIQSYLQQQYNYKYDFRWPVVGILLGFTAAALFGAVASLRYFNFEHR